MTHVSIMSYGTTCTNHTPSKGFKSCKSKIKGKSQSKGKNEECAKSKAKLKSRVIEDPSPSTNFTLSGHLSTFHTSTFMLHNLAHVFS